MSSGMPKYNINDSEELTKRIIETFNNALVSMGYDEQGVRVVGKSITKISHNEINYAFRQVYNNIFKPSRTMINNQRSLIDYNDTELLQVLSDLFIDLCARFNKSLGLMSFNYMTGIDLDSLIRWGNDRESNPTRYGIIQKLRECHKAAQVALLNDSPVGALAVANNDNETGLNWSRQQALEQANNAVFLIPSERVNRLNLEKVDS